MGEIGRPADEVKHHLEWWEIRCIIRGYNRRSRDIWSSSRWSTYNIMAAFAGSKALTEAGINSPTDLIHFPWDGSRNDMPTADEIAEMQSEIEALNSNPPQ